MTEEEIIQRDVIWLVSVKSGDTLEVSAYKMFFERHPDWYPDFDADGKMIGVFRTGYGPLYS